MDESSKQVGAWEPESAKPSVWMCVEGGGAWGGFLEEVMFELIYKGCQWKEVGFRDSVCTHSFLCS